MQLTVIWSSLIPGLELNRIVTNQLPQSANDLCQTHRLTEHSVLICAVHKSTQVGSKPHIKLIAINCTNTGQLQ